MDADLKPDAAIRPDAAEMAAELERILASDSFSASKRLSAFLRFVGERAIGGRTGEIKEYQIGAEVYGRGTAFDPKLDNIVRVEASRLRAKLREYYQNGGSPNPVRIEIPRGTYVPLFRWTVAAEPAPAPAPKPRSRLLSIAIAAVLLTSAVLLATRFFRPDLSMRRRIAVIAFKEIPSGHAATPWLSTALSELVTIDLAEVEGVQTIPADAAAQMRKDLGLGPTDGLGRMALQRVRQNIGADLVVAGTYAADPAYGPAGIRLDLRVQDTWSGNTIATASETASADDLFALASRACTDLRAGLGLKKETGSSTAVTSNSGAMRLYSEGLDALRRFDAPQAREKLEQSIQADPSNPLAWSALAEAWHTLGNDDKARETAHQALTLSDHLGRVERLGIEARAHMNAKEWREAARVYAALWRMAPDSLDDGLRLAECQIFGGEPKNALVTLHKLRELPRPLGDDPRIDFSEARAYGAMGDYRPALEPIRKAEQKAKQRGQQLLYARARRYEAGLLGTLDLPGRLDALAESKKLCDELGDRVCVISALRVDAINEIHSHPAHARALYEQALTLARDAGAADEAAALREGLIIADMLLGEFASAEQICHEAIDAAMQRGGGPEFFQYELATVYARQGLVAQAHALYDQVLKITRPSQEEPTFSNTLNALTELQLLEGKPKEAAESAREALDVVRRTGSADGLFDALVGEGDVLTQLGDWQGAHKSYDEAQKHVEGRVPANTGEMEAALGEWSLRQGDGPEAERRLRAAVEAFQSMDYVNKQLWSQAELVRALIAQQKMEDARKLAAEIAPAAQNTQDVEIKIRILLAEAQVAALGNERAKARQTLNAALAQAKLAGFGELERQARQLEIKM